ncbi:MAG: hypothetical protein JWQ21_3029 [Herminiimonas sp.]|nr:hypothetical protein [Herminiimonas sp.]
MHSNNKTPGVEHFVTLFDNNFLPVGLCLHASLLAQEMPFNLWILCMDELVEQHLLQLALPHVSLIPLREVETPRLLAVKPLRSRGEYCWTLTPFTPQFVFERDAQVERVTYLDSDLFFFDSPRLLLDEFESAEKHVLITEHAYDPRYDKTKRSGRFCVQFMTFRRTKEASKVMQWWQERCLEWCYARVEAGKFGDQKYLDQWPLLFEREVHILQQKEKTLAPWNASYFERRGAGNIAPVFYHFHGLRIISSSRLLLYSGYRIGEAANALYQVYMSYLFAIVASLKKKGIPVPQLPPRKDFFGRCLTLKRRIWDGEGYAPMPSQE